MNRIFLPLRAALLAALAFPTASFACSSCGCTLSSDWDTQGYSAKTGLHFDLRYDYVNQSQLRHGTDAVDRDAIEIPNEREIELYTVNRYTTLGIDYSWNANWGVDVELPYVDREHATFPEDETEISTSNSQSIGDVRVLGRYQGFTPEHNVGVQFGLKLPTGSHDVVFREGSEAGEPLDRGLQPGTGTTDLLLGAYKFGNLGQDWDAFGQAQVQVALDSSDEFRAGNSINLNVGVRYLGNETWVPQLQLNARVAAKDSGEQADADNSGGTLVDLSPGLSFNPSPKLHLFGFVQVPLYQRVNGLQLAPRITASIGARFAF